MADQEALERAKKKVEAKIGFYIHLTVYVGVNLLLLIINLATLPEVRKGFFKDFWFYWPLLGWGIGIIFHALGVYLTGSNTSLKERMIEKELAKEEAAAEEENKKE
ncbi:MAG: 2TM domain-containing protein [Planctomycetota bacterium]